VLPHVVVLWHQHLSIARAACRLLSYITYDLLDASEQLRDIVGQVRADHVHRRPTGLIRTQS
jgi:hypothetical protein